MAENIKKKQKQKQKQANKQTKQKQKHKKQTNKQTKNKQTNKKKTPLRMPRGSQVRHVSYLINWAGTILMLKGTNYLIGSPQELQKW